MKKHNLNDCIYFRLTDLGKELFAQHWMGFKLSIPPPQLKYIKGDIVEMQLWEFANIYGTYLYNGAFQIVVNNAYYHNIP